MSLSTRRCSLRTPRCRGRVCGVLCACFRQRLPCKTCPTPVRAFHADGAALPPFHAVSCTCLKPLNLMRKTWNPMRMQVTQERLKEELVLRRTELEKIDTLEVRCPLPVFTMPAWDRFLVRMHP